MSNKSSPKISVKDSSQDPAPTLAFAATCFRNAISILCCGNQTEGAGLVNEGQRHNCLGMAPMADRAPDFVSVLGLPKTSKSTLLRVAILVKQAFVALCLDDHVNAAESAEEVLRMASCSDSSAIPSGYVILARLYCAEALIYLDRISDAISVLDPRVIAEVSDASFRETDDDGNASNNTNSSGNNTANPRRGTSNHEVAATRALMNFNLSVAYLMRDDFDKASDLIDSLWASRHTHRLGRHVLAAKVYVFLRRGNLAACKDLIKQSAVINPRSRGK